MSTHEQRLLAVIKFHGYVTGLDLKLATGLPCTNHHRALYRAIDTGLIESELIAQPGRKPQRVYRWMGGRAAPTTSRNPKKRAKRTCLCCGKPFDSESAMNRLCAGCKGNASRNATPFDIPATIRYR